MLGSGGIAGSSAFGGRCALVRAERRSIPFDLTQRVAVSPVFDVDEVCVGLWRALVAERVKLPRRSVHPLQAMFSPGTLLLGLVTICGKAIDSSTRPVPALFCPKDHLTAQQVALQLHSVAHTWHYAPPVERLRTQTFKKRTFKKGRGAVDRPRPQQGKWTEYHAPGQSVQVLAEADHRPGQSGR